MNVGHPAAELTSLRIICCGAASPRSHDVLVVTQKVVSKAEGAFVDLATIEPRPEAVAYAARWGRDARQVESSFGRRSGSCEWIAAW